MTAQQEGGLGPLVAGYHTLARRLASGKVISAAEARRSLAIRDQIAAALARGIPLSEEGATLLIEGDIALRAAGPRLGRIEGYSDWRPSLSPREAGWWWQLDSQPAGALLGNLWIAACNAVTVGAITYLIILVVGSGPAGLKVWETVFLSLVGLLGTANLSQPLGMVLDWVRRRWGERWAELTRLALPTLGLTLALWGLVFGVPWWAQQVYRNGVALYERQALAEARQELEYARRLDQTYGPINYELGVLYEDLGLLAEATEAYRNATAAEQTLLARDLAYNNLGRLYILADKPEQAVVLLLKASRLAEDPATKFTTATNMAWARVNQGEARYDDARRSLKEAELLLTQLPPETLSGTGGQDRLVRPAAFYCLSAQTSLAEEAERRKLWDQCERFSRPDDPDGERWLTLARTALATPAAP